MNRTLSVSEVLSGILGGAFSITMLAFAAGHGYPPHSLIVPILCSYIPGVLLHELAHALAATATGTKVSCIKLGRTQRPTGKNWTVRFLGYRWELYSLPISGAVFIYPTQVDHYRTRRVIITAAGPLASLSLAALGMLFIWERWTSLPPACWLGWIFVNFYFFLFTSIPVTRVGRGRVSQTDGSLIQKILKMTDADIRQQTFHASLQMGLLEEGEAMKGLSIEESLVRHKAHPERAATLIHLVDKMAEADDPRQGIFILRLTSIPQLSDQHVSGYLDSYLTQHLINNKVTGHEYLDEISQRLVIAANNSVSARGTRGSVLIDLGRLDEGNLLLEEVLKESSSLLDQTFANVFLAVGAKRKGDYAIGRKLADTARKLNPKCASLARVSDLLEPPP